MKKSFLIVAFILALMAGAAFFIWPKKEINKNANVLSAIAPESTPSEKKCPSGFVLVPGNTLYKTSDFCVMKYDAKCSNSDPKCETGEGVYKNNQPGCECQGNFHVVSTTDGAPITFIPEISSDGTNAKNYCQKEGWHLITNAEWMTIARNVEQVQANWCDKNGTNCGAVPGTPGKILVNGHNDGSPNRALAAGTDDQPTFGTEPNPQKRTMTLSNGKIIWDFAGNVWQWIDATIERRNEPRTLVPGLGNYRWTWGELSSVPESIDYTPSDPKLNSIQGIGRIFHFNSLGDTDTTLYTFIRAGNWRHGYDSGAFTIHMQPVPNKTNIDDVGFRCATLPSQ